MSNTRELLELAAKAAGYVLGSHTQNHGVFCLGGVEWNPIADDGDALRLAVKLRMLINVTSFFTDATDGSFVNGVGEEAHGDDPYAATRLAIVRAAAEIGRAMP